MLRCCYWWCTILLHRPFFARRARPIQHSDREVDHVKASAENTLELLETWSALYGLRVSPPTLVQLIYSAATVFFLFALQATSSLRIAHASLRAALLQMEQCLRYLDEMGQAWECAPRTRDMLRSVLYNKLRPIIKKRLAAHKGVVEDLPAIDMPLEMQGGLPLDASGQDTAGVASSGRCNGMLPDVNISMATTIGTLGDLE